MLVEVFNAAEEVILTGTVRVRTSTVEIGHGFVVVVIVGGCGGGSGGAVDGCCVPCCPTNARGSLLHSKFPRIHGQ
jgi:hypothetical protein